MRNLLCLLIFSCFCSCMSPSKPDNIEYVVYLDPEVQSDFTSVYNDSITLKSKGGVYLDSKELFITENDTSYYLKISNCVGMHDVSNGNFYMMLNDSCYHYINDSINLKFFTSGSLDNWDKLIWLREADTTYTICISESDTFWSVFEDLDTGELVYEYES